MRPTDHPTKKRGSRLHRNRIVNNTSRLKIIVTIVAKDIGHDLGIGVSILELLLQ